MTKSPKTHSGFAHIILVAALTAALVAAAGIGVWRVQAQISHNKAVTQAAANKQKLLLATKAASKATTAPKSLETPPLTAVPAPSASTKAVAATTKTSSISSPHTTTTIVPTPAPITAPVPIVNTTSCMPADASLFEKAMATTLTSAYLGPGGYSPTIKFRAALNYAGLLSTVDNAKVVVFAPNDYSYDNSLSVAQLAYMNQSPANMRSVIGWHIITSCVIWHGNIQNVKSTITLQTLNGAVTYTPGGTGKIEAAEIAMWDWFTTNGAVHYITAFIHPPQI